MNAALAVRPHQQCSCRSVPSRAELFPVSCSLCKCSDSEPLWTSLPPAQVQTSPLCLSSASSSGSFCLSFTSPLQELLHFALVERDLSICPSSWPPPWSWHSRRVCCCQGKEKKMGKKQREGEEEKKKTVSCSRQTVDDIEDRYEEVKLTLQETEWWYYRLVCDQHWAERRDHCTEKSQSQIYCLFLFNITQSRIHCLWFEIVTLRILGSVRENILFYDLAVVPVLVNSVNSVNTLSIETFPLVS